MYQLNFPIRITLKELRILGDSPTERIIDLYCHLNQQGPFNGYVAACRRRLCKEILSRLSGAGRKGKAKPQRVETTMDLNLQPIIDQIEKSTTG